MDGEEEVKKGPTTAKLMIRGTFTNGIPLALLYVIAKYLDLANYVYISLGMQYLVFLFHGLPFSSEKFYDLSGSITHFALVVASLTLTSSTKSPRQIMIALASVIWMVRLGSFLFLRIEKDGKDGRFDHLKKNWLSFMGAWTIQALWVVLIQMPIILINTQVDSAPITWVDYLMLATWTIAFIIEVAADV